MSRASYKFVSTYQYELPDSDWNRHVRLLELPCYAPQPCSLIDEIKISGVILREALREDGAVLNSTSGRLHPDVLAAVLLGFVPKRRRPHIVMVGAMWQPNEGLRHLLEKFLLRLADRAIDRYIVQSSEEVEEFPRLWGIDREKVRLCLYHYSLKDAELSQPAPPAEDFVFSGGNSHRDYAPLLEAARRLPEKRFVIATRLLDDANDVPDNVRVGQTSHQEFVRLLRSSKVVVVPMLRGLKRAVGQQTYLNAMLSGKPTIVSDGFGIRDHVAHGETGLIVDGSPQSYVDAIQWVYDPENAEAVTAMSHAAQEAAQTFHYSHHINCIARQIDELVRDTQA
jgi:glycosyltransferase involved in cell wall biosynthesis